MSVSRIARPNTLRLTAQETQLLDLWYACGLGPVLEQAQGIEPVLLYLQQAPAATEQNRLSSKLSGPYFAIIKRSLGRSAFKQLPLGDAQSFVWVFRNLSYQTVLRLLQATLSGDDNKTNYTPCTYDAAHPNFASNEAKWDKYCTLLALEGFPVELSYSLTRAVHWLSTYEALQDRFTGYPLLPKMRRSLIRMANRGHHELFNAFGHRPSEMRPRTAGARKYMSVKGLDRLAMMRHHAYLSSRAC